MNKKLTEDDELTSAAGVNSDFKQYKTLPESRRMGMHPSSLLSTD